MMMDRPAWILPSICPPRRAARCRKESEGPPLLNLAPSTWSSVPLALSLDSDWLNETIAESAGQPGRLSHVVHIRTADTGLRSDVSSYNVFSSKAQSITVRPGKACLDGRASILNQAQALDRFLASVERRAFRMAQIATGNKEEALDLVQEAMLNLVQRYADRDGSEWGPLFHCILQSRIRDWYRRTRVRNRWREWFGKPRDDGEDPLETVADPLAAPPDEELKKKRACAALDAALRTLPLRQQQAFLLRAWEELDVAQTAAAMNCSEGSVKTHFFRAVRALRKQLGDHWP